METQLSSSLATPPPSLSNNDGDGNNAQNEGGGGHTSINDLPNEILVEIFKRLDDKDDHGILSLVSHRWNFVVNQLIGRVLVVDYEDWDFDEISKEEYEFQFLKLLFSGRYVFRKMIVGRKGLHWSDRMGFTSPDIITMLIKLKTWMSSDFQIPVEDDLWKNRTWWNVPQLISVVFNEVPTPGLAYIMLVNESSRIKSLTIHARRFPLIHPETLNLSLDNLKDLTLSMECYRNLKGIMRLLTFFKHCNFPKMTSLSLKWLTTTWDDPFETTLAVVTLMEAILSFIHKYRLQLEILQVVYSVQGDHYYSEEFLKPTPRLPPGNERIMERINQLSTITSCPVLKSLTIDDIRTNKPGPEHCIEFVSNTWLNFMQGQKNLEQVSVGIGLCHQGTVNSICSNSRDFLQTLVVCKVTGAVGPLPLEFDCSCLRSCTKLVRFALKINETESDTEDIGEHPGTKMINVRNNLPPSLKEIWTSQCLITNEDAQYILNELPNLDTAYLHRAWKGEEDIGQGDRQGYGVPFETLSTVLNARKIRNITLIDSLNKTVSSGRVEVSPTVGFGTVTNAVIPTYAEFTLKPETGEYEVQVEEDNFACEDFMVHESALM